MVEFRVNDYMALRLENGKTVIYVAGKRFIQCKYLLLDIPIYEIAEMFLEIESIDEIAKKLDKSMEDEDLPIIIPAKVEFWGHCSNLQVWWENDYDTRILHSNISFPLLKKLAEIGDPIANRRLNEEIAKRFSQGNETIRNFLVEEWYMDLFNREEFLSLNIQQIEIIHELEDLVGTRIKFKTIRLGLARETGRVDGMPYLVSFLICSSIT